MSKLRLFALFFGLIVFGYASAFWSPVLSVKAATASEPLFGNATEMGHYYIGNTGLVVLGKPQNRTAWAMITSRDYNTFVTKLGANEPIPDADWYNKARALVNGLGVIACDANADFAAAEICIQPDQKTTTNWFKSDFDGILQQLNTIRLPVQD